MIYANVAKKKHSQYVEHKHNLCHFKEQGYRPIIVDFDHVDVCLERLQVLYKIIQQNYHL